MLVPIIVLYKKRLVSYHKVSELPSALLRQINQDISHMHFIFFIILCVTNNWLHAVVKKVLQSYFCYMRTKHVTMKSYKISNRIKQFKSKCTDMKEKTHCCPLGVIKSKVIVVLTVSISLLHEHLVPF